MRNHSPLISSSSFYSNDDSNEVSYTKTTFSGDNHPSLLSFTTFTSCIFDTLTSSSNGGAVSFLSGKMLTVVDCLFSGCTTSIRYSYSNGGGAICIESGTFSIISSVFISCTTLSYGGGIFVHDGSQSSTVTFCTFIDCKADHGGGLTTYYGPSSTVLSNIFLSCSAYSFGGGVFHDGLKSHFISLSNSLFADNKANSDNDRNRGGGGFEDYRDSAYTSTYSFCFFSRNTAVRGVGYDVCAHDNKLDIHNIIHCFTITNPEVAFWNNGTYQSNEDADWFLILMYHNPYE